MTAQAEILNHLLSRADRLMLDSDPAAKHLLPHQVLAARMPYVVAVLLSTVAEQQADIERLEVECRSGHKDRMEFAAKLGTEFSELDLRLRQLEQRTAPGVQPVPAVAAPQWSFGVVK